MMAMWVRGMCRSFSIVPMGCAANRGVEKPSRGTQLRTRGQTGLAANFRQNAPEIHASLVSPRGLPWPAGGVADFQDGGEADSDGFRLRDHAFDAVQQNLRGTGADTVGGLNHGGDRRREQIVHGELVEGGEGDIARRLQAAIAKGAQDAEGGGAVGAEDGIRAGGGIRELRAADDAYVLGTEIAVPDQLFLHRDAGAEERSE